MAEIHTAIAGDNPLRPRATPTDPDVAVAEGDR